MKAPVEGPLLASGPSFAPVVKGAATLLVGMLAYWGTRAADTLGAARLGWSAWLLLGGATLFVLLSYFAMLRGRTTISASHIVQHGLVTRRVALAEVTHAKLIDFPSLRWLISPRLKLRMRGGGIQTIFVAGSELLACIDRLGLGRAMAPQAEGKTRSQP